MKHVTRLIELGFSSDWEGLCDEARIQLRGTYYEKTKLEVETRKPMVRSLVDIEPDGNAKALVSKGSYH